MTNPLHFHARVGQVVQAESFSQVLQLPIVRPRESQLRAEFTRLTGIDCCRAAREWLEHLMEHHGFGPTELANAWRVNSIGWRRGGPRFSTPLLEVVFAWAVLLGLGVYSLGLVVLLTLFEVQGHEWIVVPVLGFFIGFVALYAIVHRYVLWPRRVALRVRRRCSDACRSTSQPPLTYQLGDGDANVSEVLSPQSRVNG